VRKRHCEKIKRRSSRARKEAGRISEREGKRDSKETGNTEEIRNGRIRETEEKGTERC
jgi:hypothetical protein